LRQLLYRLSITGISAGRRFSLVAQAAQTSGWQPHRQPLFLCHAGGFLRRKQKFKVTIANERTQISARFHYHLLEL
jgi:hypothetical protein